nr:TonB-dependent receptor [Campylobacterota bacterium]
MFIRGFITLSVVAACNLIATEKSDNNTTQLGIISVIGEGSTRATSAVTEETVKAMYASGTNVLKTVDRLPGVNFEASDNMGMDEWVVKLNVRGYDKNALGYTVDGVPTTSNYTGASPWRLVDPENLETVEVSQGAADISSPGLNALGGTLQYRSSMPKDEETIKIKRTQGSYNHESSYVRYDTGLFNDDATSAYISYSDTYVNHWTNSVGKAHKEHVDTKVVHNMDRGSLAFKFSYSDREEDDYYTYFNLGDIDKYCGQQACWDGMSWEWTGDPAIDQNHVDSWSGLREDVLFTLNGDFEVTEDSDLTFTLYNYTQDGKGQWAPPFQYVLDAEGNIAQDADGNDIKDRNNSSHRESDYDWTKYGGTLNYTHKIGFNEISAGVWLEQSNRITTQNWYYPINPDVYWYPDLSAPYLTRFQTDSKLQTTMGYLADKIQLLDNKLDINLGIRFIHANLDLDVTDKIAGDLAYDTDLDSGVLPNIGALYRITNEHQVFANFAQNAKMIPTGYHYGFNDFRNIDPEKATNYDLGYRFSGDTLGVSATAYYNKYEDKFITVEDSEGDALFISGTDIYSNSEGQEVVGLEVAGDYKVNEKFSTYGALTISEGEYSGDHAASGIQEGKKVVDLPEYMVY